MSMLGTLCNTGKSEDVASLSVNCINITFSHVLTVEKAINTLLLLPKIPPGSRRQIDKFMRLNAGVSSFDSVVGVRVCHLLLSL